MLFRSKIPLDVAASEDFEMIFSADNMKLLPGDYDVEISSKGLSHWAGDKVEYWVAVEKDSKYG